ncbi:CHAT domain-containing tetratricopeptide repeat protein [Nonomuraea angiospora]|uniref:CHAT domain-containing protein n=1 Tax=Nonomuraea angiospora TaxID=46172 RepID=UPI0034475AE5
MRLRLFPELSVGAEADLWGSQWVTHRSPRYLVLRPDVLPTLRAGLRDLLRTARDADRSLPIWEIISAAHADLTPALLLEERLTWLAVSGEGDPAMIERELATALRALVLENRTGVAEWAIGAWRRLPAEVLTTTAAWQLASVAGQYFPVRPVPGSSSAVTPGDVAAIAGAIGANVQLRVLLDGARLLLGDVHGPGVRAIEVPDTDPRIVEIEFGDGQRVPIRVGDGEVVSVNVAEGPVTLHTSRATYLAERTDGDFSAWEPHLIDDGFGAVPDPRLRSGSQTDLDDLIRELSTLPPGAELADALLHSYDLTGGRDLLDQAIEILRGITSESSDALRSLLVLASGLLRRYEAYGDPADLNESIVILRSALDRLPVNSPEIATFKANLGMALGTRFRVTGQIDDLDEAVEATRQAIATLPSLHPNLAPALANLAELLEIRADAGGYAVDVDEVVNLYETAVAVSRDEGPWHRSVLAGLAGALLTRFRLYSDRQDLDRAIELARQAAAADDVEPLSGMLLSNLADALLLRHQVTGFAGDLDEAVELGTRALTLARNSIRAPTVMLRLAQSLQARFEQSRSAEAIDSALAILQEAASEAGRGSAEYIGALTALSTAARLRYSILGDPDDLMLGVQSARRARDAASFESARARAAETNLALALLARYRATGDRGDLDEAASAGERALTGTPDFAPHQAQVFSAAAAIRHERYLATGLADDEQAAFTLWSAVADNAAAPLSVRLDAAAGAAGAAIELGLWDRALAICEQGVALLALGVSTRATVTADLERLERFAELSRDGAACAIVLGLPERAVELLEWGRGAQWSRLLDLRSDLTRLEAAQPELAARFATIRARLDGVPATGEPDDHDSRRNLARSWDRVLAEVRAVPGFESFLRPPHFAELAQAAAEGPVVIINMSRVRCDALIVTVQGVFIVALPMADLNSARSMVTAAAASREGGSQPQEFEWGYEVLSWLWAAIVSPVLVALDWDDGRPNRLWWCPTGIVSLLPLHAAGDGRRSALDTVVSSYTPSLRLLIDARARPGRTMPSLFERMLIVSEPYPGPESLPRLPLARRETSLIQEMVPEAAVLTERAATIQAVLKVLPTVDSFHFAGHGVGEHAQLGNSGLVLANGILGVDDIAPLRLRGELAYLSACSSGALGTISPDQALSPAVALHVAGFRNVVAVMDVITDEAALRVARSFYERLSRGETAAWALNHALRELSARYRRSTAQFFHIGP